MNNKYITTTVELEEYMNENDLNNILYARQIIVPNFEALSVILLGTYLQVRGIIVKKIGAYYSGDDFISRSLDKVITVKGSGILISKKGEEVKVYTFGYRFTNPAKWEKKKMEDIECENLEIVHARPEYLIENPLTYVECKNRRVIDIWKELLEELNYLYSFDSFSDATKMLSGKRAIEYYKREYPEFIEKVNKAVLIDNFDGTDEKLKELLSAYNGKIVRLDFSPTEIIKFGNVQITPRSLVLPSQRVEEIKEIIEEALERSIKKVPQNENNLIKIQRILYKEFVKNLFNRS